MDKFFIKVKKIKEVLQQPAHPEHGTKSENLYSAFSLTTVDPCAAASAI
jgi:hypothetical protein